MNKIADLRIKYSEPGKGKYTIYDVNTGIEIGLIDRVVGVNNRPTGSWSYTRFSDNKINWRAGNTWSIAAIRLGKSCGYKDE